MLLSSLRWQEEEWLVLQDQDTRLPLPLITNNTFPVYPSLGVTNGSREMSYGNWGALGKRGTIEIMTGLFLISCSFSSALRLDSRASQTPSSTFNRARLCSFDLCLTSLARRAYSSALSRACCSSSAFSLESSTRRDYSSASSRACSSSSSDIRLAS